MVAPPLRSGAAVVPGGLTIFVAILIIIVAVLNLNIPYFALAPGPAPNVIDLIEIKGTKTRPVGGKLLLTTVSLHEIRVAEAIRGWFDSSYEVLSRSAIIPTGETEQDAEQRTTAQMDESQEHAAAAALALLGYDVKITSTGARVLDFIDGVPATKVLRRGDVIVKADARPVHERSDLQAIIQRHAIGDAVTLTVRRGAETLTLTTKAVASVEDPSRPVIGVFLDDVPRVALPLAIDIDSLGIGGPSAGLMYALGIVDLLDSADLTKGRTIAGTGAITVDGEVRPVGGIRQKVAAARGAGAELFLAPLIELEEACSRAGPLRIVGVEHLKDATRALKGFPVPAGRSC